MFEGTAECDNAFNTLKERLRDTKLFSLYDPKKKTELVVDASPIGLGAILCQLKPSGTSSIIAFASKALTPTERRYSQTERQALSIIWGCEQFRLYLLGIPVTVWTDQKSLVPLFNNPNATLSARMERSMLRKQPFNITVQYLPGEWNAADFSSRHRDIETQRKMVERKEGENDENQPEERESGAQKDPEITPPIQPPIQPPERAADRTQRPTRRPRFVNDYV